MDLVDSVDFWLYVLNIICVKFPKISYTKLSNKMAYGNSVNFKKQLHKKQNLGKESME